MNQGPVFLLSLLSGLSPLLVSIYFWGLFFETWDRRCSAFPKDACLREKMQGIQGGGGEGGVFQPVGDFRELVGRVVQDAWL